MKFYASVRAQDGGAPPTLIIECHGDAAAFDAKKYAAATLGTNELLFQETGSDAVADVVLRWVGNDAGPVPNRRMQVRKRGERNWRDWP